MPTRKIDATDVNLKASLAFRIEDSHELNAAPQTIQEPARPIIAQVLIAGSRHDKRRGRQLVFFSLVG